MVNYQNSKIYKLIYNNDTIYIGSTTVSLSRRLSKHKEYSKNNTSKIHTYLRTVNLKDISIVLVESFPCDNNEELRKREQYWKEEYTKSNNLMNVNRCFNTKEDHLNRRRERRKNGHEKTNCSVCNVLINRDKYKNHLIIKHSPKSNINMDIIGECEKCHKVMNKKSIIPHMRKFH